MSDSERTLFVGGLTDKTTEELLYELFLQAGPLEKVTIPKEKDGKKKKFAFVTFRHEDSVPYSIKVMEGIQLHGQTLRLQPRTGSSHSSPYSSPYGDAQEAIYPGAGTPPYQRSSSWQDNTPTRMGEYPPFRSPQYQPSYRHGRSDHKDRSYDHDRDRSSSRDRLEGRSKYDQYENHSHHHRSHGSDTSDRGRLVTESDRSPVMSPLPAEVGQILLNSVGYPGGPQFQPERMDPISLELRRQRLLSQQGLSLRAHRQHNYDRYDRGMQPRQSSLSQRRRY